MINSFKTISLFLLLTLGMILDMPSYVNQCCGSSQQLGSAKEQKNVLSLASLPHGLINLRPVKREQFEQVRSQPVEYVPIIEMIIEAELKILKTGASEDDLRKLGVADELMNGMLHAEGLESQPLRRIGGAISLLQSVNPPSAEEYIGKIFVELERMRINESNPKRRHELLRMQDALLVGGDRADRRIISIILQRLPETKYYDRGPYYLYLQKSAVGNEEVIQKLMAMARDKESPLHHHTPNGSELVSGQVMAQDKENPLHDHGGLLETIDALSGKSAKTNQLIHQPRRVRCADR